MANMSYCRFRNTLEDLRDCWRHLDDVDEDSNDSDEQAARKKLIVLCNKIAQECRDELEEMARVAVRP